MHVAFLNVEGKTMMRGYDAILAMFLMSMADFEDIYEEFDSALLPWLPKGLFLVYMVLVTLLLMNLLIAMMGKTYSDIVKAKKEYLRQWAQIVLLIEQTITKDKRKWFRVQYSKPRDEARSGDVESEDSQHQRVLVLRWHMSVSVCALDV